MRGNDETFVSTETALDFEMEAYRDQSLTGLPNFLVFFVIAIALDGAYLLLYTLATAHNEFLLIRQNVISAAVALGFSLVGFALPLASAIVHAQNILDCLIWGLVALAVQIFAYWTRPPRDARPVPADRGRRDGGGSLPRGGLPFRRHHQRGCDDVLTANSPKAAPPTRPTSMTDTKQRSTIVQAGSVRFGNHLPLAIIAGPCAMESRDHALEMASALKEITGRLGIGLVYKSSFDKANRTSASSARGIGLDKACRFSPR